MSRGATNIKPNVESLILTMAWENPNEPRALTAIKIAEAIDKMGEISPAEDTLKKMISAARNNKNPEDEPWCLGTLKYNTLPIESLSAVLNVYKLCLAGEIPLTIREAKWVARLHTIISDTTTLWSWAWVYARRERACEAMKKPKGVLRKPIDTSALDAALVMNEWELATARWTDMIELPDAATEWTLSRPAHTHISSSKFAAENAERFIWAPLLGQQVGTGGRIPLGSSLPLAPLEELNLTEEAEWIYTYWLNYLRHGPKWSSLSAKEIVDTILVLRGWITNHPWLKKPNEAKPLLLWMDPAKLSKEHDFMPTTLLKKVGYEVKPTKEGRHERAHSQAQSGSEGKAPVQG